MEAPAAEKTRAREVWLLNRCELGGWWRAQGSHTEPHFFLQLASIRRSIPSHVKVRSTWLTSTVGGGLGFDLFATLALLKVSERTGSVD